MAGVQVVAAAHMHTEQPQDSLPSTHTYRKQVVPCRERQAEAAKSAAQRRRAEEDAEEDRIEEEARQQRLAEEEAARQAEDARLKVCLRTAS